ncbi:DUF4225 domain-containing protein [Vibrio mangrovi]|uniref:DUF4225 domain-containing protein n=1 Tax=Vibrio mangrovi TaxID=474394 RepID=A0ABU4I2H6_9VIBR|nr:DUF4225 domain-containing protein [Vibrio mangrovi]MDW6002136.1 DUF4225 domain-containing protein [Vibrio mangrovi]
MNSRTDLYTTWQVQQSSKRLVTQASHITAQHVKSSGLRNMIIREYESFSNSLVRLYEDGKKTAQEVMHELEMEAQELYEQHSVFIQKGIGLYAGVMQIVGGVSVIVISDGAMVPYGVPLILHGINNVYENTMYFLMKNEDAVGPVRALYQYGAESLELGDSVGDTAYYTVDIGLSLYGLFGKTALRPGSWKLFRRIPSDYCRGIEVISKPGLAAEVAGDAVTLESIHNEMAK